MDANSIKPDIFNSNELFIQRASMMAIVVGIMGLAGTFGCRFFGWGICEQNLVPIFGDFDGFREELARINLPLALVILGIGLRLYSRFGWLTCSALLLFMGLGFTYISYLMWAKYFEFSRVLAQTTFNQVPHAILESIFVDTILALLCWGGFVFLMTPSVRRLYLYT